MKNLFPIVLLGLVLISAFSSCKKGDPPVSSIVYYGHLLVGEEIRFENSNYNASHFDWNFGDGTTKEGGSQRHTYNAPGTYTVQLTVRNANGQHTSSITVNIRPFPKKVKIKKVILEKTDFQTDWDPVNMSGPDIYFNIEDTNTGNILVSSSISTNSTTLLMPLVWGLQPPFEMEFLSSNSIVFRDDDGNTSDVMCREDFRSIFSLAKPFDSNIISYTPLLYSHSTINFEVEYIY